MKTLKFTKYIILLSLFLLSGCRNKPEKIPSSAAGNVSYYLDSQNGNDSNDGLHRDPPGKHWQKPVKENINPVRNFF